MKEPTLPVVLDVKEEEWRALEYPLVENPALNASVRQRHGEEFIIEQLPIRLALSVAHKHNASIQRVLEKKEAVSDSVKLNLQMAQWIPTTERQPEVCKPVIGYADRWVDSEYNETGMRECFRNDDYWQSAAWNNYQDCWDVALGAPDYWIPYSEVPLSARAASDGKEQGKPGQNELLSCPFCGSKARLETKPFIDGTEWHFIRCGGAFLVTPAPTEDCRVCGVQPRTAGSLSFEHAAEEWNKRAAISVSDGAGSDASGASSLNPAPTPSPANAQPIEERYREALDALASVCTCTRPAVQLLGGGVVMPGPHTKRCVARIAREALAAISVIKEQTKP